MYTLPEKLIAGKYYVKVNFTFQDDDTIKCRFPFNRILLNEIKAFDGARWNSDGKFWTIKNNQRNRFQLDYLAGRDPYGAYDKPLIEYTPTRSLRSHQVDMVRAGLTYHYTIWAAEMGTGKTLAAIEVMEASGFDDWIFVGPRSALASVKLELIKWQSKVQPQFYTYDGLRKLVQQGGHTPRGVIFDESSRVKTPTAQRSIAAQHLADSVREEYGEDGFAILMSGSPAPKSPADWWKQAEIARPGFLREGTYEKFKHRLGLIVSKESITGGTYPHLITWKDDERKCQHCGQFADHPDHAFQDTGDAEFDALTRLPNHHEFEASTNEVSYLYERMKGLVIVKFKKDCLDLPDKQYRIIECKPTREILQAAKLIVAGSPSTITALTLLRELSDGFQYQDAEVGTDTCSLCHGDCTIIRPMPAEDSDEYEEREISCPTCGGAGEVPRYKRETHQVPCPKEDVLKDILDSHDEDGRLVTYAGFSGSVDRCCQIVQAAGWQYIRVDGRGWSSSFSRDSPESMLQKFQDKSRAIERLAFIGQPSAAGMGLTLTEACEIVYYSNDFNAESRIQSEDRIHRMGMDVNRGALITDIAHLPTDIQIIENLKQKRRLQDMSLGQFRDAIMHMAVTSERKF